MSCFRQLRVVATEAKRRVHGSSPVLFDLLDAMDGAAADADLLFVLTTNRPDLPETALAARPGRVDVAVEIALPDVEARRRLFALYARRVVRGRDPCLPPRPSRRRRGGLAPQCAAGPAAWVTRALQVAATGRRRTVRHQRSGVRVSPISSVSCNIRTDSWRSVGIRNLRYSPILRLPAGDITEQEHIG